jgi:TctA family transporter
MLISGADVLLQNQISDVKLPLYHTLIVVFFQGLLCTLMSVMLRLSSSRIESNSLAYACCSESKCAILADSRYISGDSTASAS